MAQNSTLSSTFIPMTAKEREIAIDIYDLLLDEADEQGDFLEYCVEQQTEEPEGIIICHDESFNVSAAAEYVQQVLNRLNRDDLIVMSYAYVCSAPRPGEFGGGAVLIGRDSMTSTDAQYVMKKEAEARGNKT